MTTYYIIKKIEEELYLDLNIENELNWTEQKELTTLNFDTEEEAEEYIYHDFELSEEAEVIEVTI